MDRIIFLDYDGVLNDPYYLIHKSKDDSSLAPSKILLLSQICTIANAGVVLTSDWRDDESAKKRLEKFGVDVVGKTPSLPGKTRAEEIAAWIDEHNFTGQFAILDDDDGISEKYPVRFVHTKEKISDTAYQIGLNESHIIPILMRLRVGRED